MTNRSQTIAILRASLTASTLLFAVGLFAPCMTLHPRFGEYSWLVGLLQPRFLAAHSYSILSGIWELTTNGNPCIGALVFAFSVAFPTWKTIVVWGYLDRLGSGAHDNKYLSLASVLGKFSMLDVFVLGLLVLAIKGLPGGSEVKLEWGAGCFTLSIILSLVISLAIKKLPDT